MKNRIIALINLLILIIGLISIQKNVNKNRISHELFWSKNDLKLIDPIDSLTGDQCEILAVLMRKNVYEFEIRIDFLSVNDIDNCILVTRFHTPIRNEINFTVAPDSTGLDDADLNSVIFNKINGYTLLRFPLKYSKYNVEFVTREKNHNLLSDSTQQINIFQPTPSPLPITLMAFNTHPGYQPSQILRFWNGAHTGPNGQRHGLKYLLDAAGSTQIPVTLLDLNTPSGLASIEFLDISEKLKKLQASSILFLPIPINVNTPSYPIILNSFQENMINLGYVNQNLVFYNLNQQFLVKYGNYTQSIDLTPDYEIKALSEMESYQDPFSTNGLSELTIKKIFHNYLNSKNTTNILFPLNKSNIADRAYASEIFASLKSHPWLEVEIPFQQKFDTNPTKSMSESNEFSTKKILSDELTETILLSKGSFQNYLFDYINDLLGNKQSEKFVELSQRYLPNIYYYIAANQWEANPEMKTGCNQDIDNDGMTECLLISRDYFGIIELDGGRLAFLAVRSGNSVYQLIGPSSSIMFGLGPEEEWNIKESVFADPQEIPGAFFDDNGNWNNYQPVDISENSVVIIDKITNTSKKFSINEDGFRFENNANEIKSIYIPVILSPDCMRINKWQQHYNVFQFDTASNIKMNCSNETINIKFSPPISSEISSFIESEKLMLLPENPEFSYPEGFYIKIGVSLVELKYLPGDQITITVSK